MTEEDRGTVGATTPLEPGHSSPGFLEKLLRAGEFTVTAELSPPDSADPEQVFKRARIFDGSVDAINATDGSGANCHMSSVAVCALLRTVGYSVVMQVSCRDRNRIAIQGDVLGAAAIGVASVLCLTGDGVESGDHPQAKPVFDIESITLLSMLRKMRDESQFESGRKITGAPRLFLGAAANPFVPPFDFRPLRLAKKIEAGAQFIQTQYCFDIERFRQFMSSVRDLGLHEKAFILVGVGPLASARAAEWIRKNVPGVHIPDAIVERLAKSRNQREEGKRIYVEIMQQVRDIEGVSGVHVMAYRQEELIAEIIQQSGVLGHRTPWNPSQAQPSER
jgi:methylenetetrahydrofolate reductase (NADPH)